MWNLITKFLWTVGIIVFALVPLWVVSRIVLAFAWFVVMNQDELDDITTFVRVLTNLIIDRCISIIE
jgi:hypothetical protein